MTRTERMKLRAGDVIRTIRSGTLRVVVYAHPRMHHRESYEAAYGKYTAINGVKGAYWFALARIGRSPYPGVLAHYDANAIETLFEVTGRKRMLKTALRYEKMEADIDTARRKKQRAERTAEERIKMSKKGYGWR